MLPVMGYNDKDENDGKYNFEMRADAVDATGKPYRVYWIFANVEGRELEDYDYNNIDRVEEENL